MFNAIVGLRDRVELNGLHRQLLLQRGELRPGQLKFVAQCGIAGFQQCYALCQLLGSLFDFPLKVIPELFQLGLHRLRVNRGHG